MHVYHNYYKNFFTFFILLYIKMNGKTINFDNKKIKKVTFTKKQNKKIFDIDDIGINKILVSKKEPHGKNNSHIYDDD